MIRILVVEDVAEDTELLLHVLKKFPVEVETCTTAPEAKELFLEKQYHAVMVNLALPAPEPDGVELIRWMRSKSHEVLIMVVTGAEDPLRRSKAIEAGAQGFFVKPYTSEDNLILFAQLEAIKTARQIGFAKGKKARHWRTTYAGAFTATGLALFGGPMALSQTTFAVPSHMQSICIWAGLIMTVVGYFLNSLAQADKKVVERNFEDQREVNFETEFWEKQKTSNRKK